MSLSTTRAHSDTNKQKFRMWNELKGNYAKLISFNGLNDNAPIGRGASVGLR